MNELRFEWDKRKERANFKKHGVSFDEACAVFYDGCSPLKDWLTEGNI
jgi:hypothetical protein